MTVLVYAVLCVVPAAVFELCARAFDRWTARAPVSARGSGEVADEPDPCARWVKDLRRLAADHDRLLTADVPARAARLRAVELAYDDTLRHAGQALNVEVPATEFDAITRVQVEADLVLHGLAW